MTLVEVIIAMAVFAVVILGSFSLLLFSLKTTDDSRAFTQVTQILTHEMESMRLRSFDNDTAGTGQKSVKYMALNASDYKTFTPFADYSNNGSGGTGDAKVGSTQPQIGKSILGDSTLQLRSATGFECSRNLSLNNDKDQVTITLTVSWMNGRHTRALTSTVSKNGLNDALFTAKK